MPRALLALVAVIALIEVVLSLADAGILFDPSLRSRVFVAGAFWASLLHGDTPLYAAQPVTMFLSHAFLHGSLLHMVMNMTILLALGRFTADHYGARVVLPVFCPRRDRRRRGLRAARRPAPIRWWGRRGRSSPSSGSGSPGTGGGTGRAGSPTGPVLRRVGVLVLINVVTLIGLQGMLAWEAHLGGFLVGLACGCWMEGRQARSERAARAEARRQRHGGA